MIGFETIGNATVTVFDDTPILTTDPWISGNPYFGSWSHKFEIPKNQLENIKNSKFVWLSHGHPDHIDQDSFDYFSNSTFLIPDHFGDRIFNFFNQKFNAIKVESNQWLELSKNIRIKSFADWNQDASLLIEIAGKDIILNANDGSLLGWKSTIKEIIKNYKNRFLLKLVNWGDADMVNIYDEDGNFVSPITSFKPKIGKRYTDILNNLGCNFAIPFSSIHQYQREDSFHMNEHVTPLESHFDSFNSLHGELLPAFIIWDSLKEDFIKINPKPVDLIIKKPEEFGDNYSDQLDKNEEEIVANYFKSFSHLKKRFGAINFTVGGKELNIKLSNKKGVLKFEAPKNSLMTSVKYEIFDDMLIGNYMKTTIIGVKSLYPNFTPYVSKYGDNGGAKTEKELHNYFHYYKMNSADYWKDILQYQTENIVRNYLDSSSNKIKIAKSIKDKFF